MTTAQVERSTLLLLVAINGVMLIVESATGWLAQSMGLVVAGLLVSLTASSAPDLIVGTVVCAIVVRGGIRILRAAAASLEDARGGPATG